MKKFTIYARSRFSDKAIKCESYSSATMAEAHAQVKNHNAAMFGSPLRYYVREEDAR